MYKLNGKALTFLKPRAYSIALVIVWCVSLAVGRFLAFRSSWCFSSLFRSLTSSGMSYGAYFFSLMLPFLLTYFACRLKFRLGIFLLCFIKGISFSFGCCAVQYVFGSAGFLMNVLLHFSGIVSMFLLLWIWLRHMRCQYPVKKQDVFVCIVLLILLYVADVISVFPFCQKLMNLL